MTLWQQESPRLQAGEDVKRNFVRLIGVILFIAALILVTFAAGLLPLNSNQTTALLLLIAGCTGGVGLMMAIGWFSMEKL